MKINKVIWTLLIALGLSSCGTNGLFTKHRYTGGFHVNLSLKKDKGDFDVKKRTKKAKEENIAFEGKNKIDIISLNTEKNIKTLSYKNIDAPTLNFKKAKAPKRVQAFIAPRSIKQALTINSVIKPTKNEILKSPQGSEYEGFMLILLVILAIVLPPVAVAIVDGIGTHFWISILLVLAAIILPSFIGIGIASLFGLAAIIHALLIVFGVI